MVGNRVRSLRRERDMTLRELATATGLSAPLLSQIEREQTDPSLATLRKLAAVFGADLPTLLAEERPHGVHISRPGERILLSAGKGDVSYERLTPGRTDLEVLKGNLRPGQATSDDLWSHPSTECSYVLTGELVLEIGDERHALRAGESVTFDARVPHRYLNESDAIAEYVMSSTPPNP